MAAPTGGWTSLHDLLGDHPESPAALLDLPLGERSLTPGRCDLGPKTLRAILPRISTYDVETGLDLATLGLHDAGEVPLRLTSPQDAFAPVRDRVAALIRRHRLVFEIGGNNAITRPGLHGLAQGLDLPLARIGLLTLDAHFDLRDTADGLHNGNPVSALLEDGLPGRNIVQLGLAPFANSRSMHERATGAGITVMTMADIRRRGIAGAVDEALAAFPDEVEAVHVDFDIDVMERSAAPGAPGARPGGLAVRDFFTAARLIAADPRVRAIDLSEFDPALDVSNISALVAGRWLAECLMGWMMRK